MKIIKGDATCPQVSGMKLIIHIVNDSGKWGKGFVMSLSSRYSETRRAYLDWYKEGLKLGEVLFQQVRPDVAVAHMVAQRGIIGNSNPKPIRYESLRECLKKVQIWIGDKDISVHAPRIGCGLAGGKWELVEQIIKEELRAPITIYDY